MHDPMVVAFEIRRPWPRRERHYDSIRPGRAKAGPRWRFRMPFWTIAGHGLYWPPLITIWHREPGGRDSGEVCKHYVRRQDAAGKWHADIRNAWRFHIHHWRIQVHPLQALRRWALTRCAWCGGRSRKGDAVNISHQWDGPRGRWWRGEPGLYHQDCSSIESAHRACTCDELPTEHEKWGHCAACGRFRGFGRPALGIEIDRLLAAVPAGQRDPDLYARVQRMWKAAREREATR